MPKINPRIKSIDVLSEATRSGCMRATGSMIW